MKRRLAALSASMLLASPVLAASVSLPIEAPGPLGPLRGTLLDPGSSIAPVLIIPGSGPTDRDGNNPLGIRASSYKLLAEALAARGLSTVRIDKRGLFGSAGAVADGNAVTVPDYAADVRSWVATIRKRLGSRCVWLLGHSEGGLVALAATGGMPDVCGLLLLSAPGRKAGEILREQLRANPANAPVLDQALAAIAALEAGKRVNTAGMHPALMSLFAPPVQNYLISLLSYDPAALLAGTDQPVLVIQGRRDLPVTEVDARRLAAARAGVQLRLLDGVNHVLKLVPLDDRNVNFATYADPALPIAPELVDAVATFVIERK